MYMSWQRQCTRTCKLYLTCIVIEIKMSTDASSLSDTNSDYQDESYSALPSSSLNVRDLKFDAQIQSSQGRDSDKHLSTFKTSMILHKDYLGKTNIMTNNFHI